MHFDTRVAAGTISAVIGPSGAGKSTLLNIVAGFEKPDSGCVRIGGADVTGADPADRPVSMVFQENNLFSHLDVGTNVVLGIRPKLTTDPADREIVAAALDRVGLTGFEKRMPGTLSGGERQRVAIARALVRRKSVLLLDEPFAALGPRLRRDMLLLIRQLQVETGMTLLLVTHQPEEAVGIADTIIFLDKGMTVASGAASGFFDRGDIPGLADYLGHGGQ
ncbi:ATP-binding cassette domain-containing protein [Hoeflea sp. TYP-13]|uniref:thiamine ABC transporter ATP-binding protein n=1 Tax=Hoeflea sp. TYP-13 TaxID=3230023 RepID=UPI0034C68FCC